jgi:hypothetical protein
VFPGSTAPLLSQPESTGPAGRTRAATRSPRKAPTKPPPLRSKTRRAPPKRTTQKVRSANQPTDQVVPSSPDPEVEPPLDVVQQEPSPYRVPFRIRKLIPIPDDTVGISQPDWGEDYIHESELGRPMIFDNADEDDIDDEDGSHPANPSPDTRATQKCYAQDDYELSSDDDGDDEPGTFFYSLVVERPTYVPFRQLRALMTRTAAPGLYFQP